MNRGAEHIATILPTARRKTILPHTTKVLSHAGLFAAVALGFATPAFAADTKIDPADTAFMIAATALVLLMTIPGLALFYCGMVRHAFHITN